MADRQLFAKLGVVALLGINVGAYYFLWPKNNGRPMERAEPAPQSVPATPIPAAPRNFPVASVKNAEPLSIPSVPATNDKASETADAVTRLLDLIQKDNVQPIPVVGERFEAPLPIPAPAPLERKPEEPPSVVPGPNPRPLPPLQAEPIRDAAADPNLTITSALAQKSQQSPWQLNVKKSGVQTLVTAKLRRASPAKLPVEFEILCDRIDLNSTDGLLALGNITFVGAGIKGACQRLTVLWNAPGLIFDEQVRITPGGSLPSSQLRGERFVWEPPANDVDLNAAEFRPAGVLLPGTPPPDNLGAPK